MHALGVFLLALGSCAASVTASPPVSARIETPWPAPGLVTQYLETFALEQPAHLFPFLSFLASHPTSHRSVRPPLVSASTAALASTEASGTSAAFVPEGTIQQNETLAILDAAAMRSRLLRGKGQMESLHLGLAIRETSVVIEGMRGLWEQRSQEVRARSADEEEWLECESWIDVGGKTACTEQEFWTIVGTEQKEGKLPVSLPTDLSSAARPRLYSFDHVSPPGEASHLPRVVLYGSPTSPEFQDLFSFLYQLSAPKPVPIDSAAGEEAKRNTVAPHPPRLQFVLRWKPSSKAVKAKHKLVLGGYGAALDIKKGDYLAIDDRMTAQAQGDGGKQTPTQSDSSENSPKIDAVSKNDIADLSLRTAEYILASNDSFHAFTAATSSFPLLASQLPKLVPNISNQLLSEVSGNQMSSTLTRRPSFLLNGVALTDAQVDPFALVRLMRKERKFVTDLQGLSVHMTSQAARDILINGGTTPTEPSEQGMMPKDVLGEIFDSTDRQEGGDVILWWNNLEKDKRYKSWPTTVRDLLRPTYPGSMNLVARNLNNVVFVLDLSKPSSLALVSQNLKQFVSRGIPVRFGLVPIVSAEYGPDGVETELALVLWYLVEAIGRGPTIQFLADLARASQDNPVTPELLRRAYTSVFLQAEHVDGGHLAPFETIMEGLEGASLRLTKARKWLERLGIPHAGEDEIEQKAAGYFFLDGAYFPIDDDFSQNLQRTLGLHIQFLQQEAYLGSLTDKHDAQAYFADLPSTYKRRNPYIFVSPEQNPLKIVDLLDAYNGVMPSFVESFYISAPSGSHEDGQGSDAEGPAPTVTITLVTDLNEVAGLALVKAALQLADKNPSVRISLLHNPIEHYEAHPWTISNILYLLHHYKSVPELLPVELIDWIDLGLTVGGPLPRQGKDWSIENPLRSMLKVGVEDVQAHDAQFFWEELQWLVFKLGFQPGQNGIVINGRVVGPFPDDAFGIEDLETLLVYELEKRISPVVSAIGKTGFDITSLPSSQQSKIYNLASSIVQQAYLPDPAAGLFGDASTQRRQDYRSLDSNYSAIIGPNEKGALFEIAIVVDPATELAQRWAPIIETLVSLDSVHLRLYLNPTFGLTDLPIKRFYRYLFQPRLAFDETTGAERQPSIKFEGVPEDVLLTFGIDAQQSWLAFPHASVHDLDNIRLKDLPEWSRDEGVEAVLELESIIVEGHARDVPSSHPPRGLQLELHRGALGDPQHRKVDTIVMANLGYFQFKASPGPWNLAIRPGKSSDVYEIESTGANGWKSGDVAKTGTTVVVSTLEGKTLYPRFKRKEGQELAELLDESAAASGKRAAKGGFVDRLKHMIPFFAPTAPTDLVSTGKKAEINVFTVASGLLYERMAFLMMVSVMRHTKSTVKFWFIQNFLSPSFKAFIPHMAKEYGFDYELVTYKWPHWLRAQKEKQRTIWGYKILFLDVLFPLELDRVIFVDSDQIVRADLKELIDLDLEGAPYAYAPMGNDREETKGYRFWEHGYWKQHLAGRPYHISALYVVDLDRFRQIAAGDRLRQQYQALTADPGSLANLDQDLPNNMQSSLPIYTLDRSWLWCETWCSDESLATAKTIDLCNNPKTKEQKLARARRLIPEWTVYDDEVAALARRIASSPATSATSSALKAFGAKADELEQAVQQANERAEVVEQEAKAQAQDGEASLRRKDEL
ncbi:hypothetical protein JCM10212_003560 [Sporobolomyces blumeae]